MSVGRSLLATAHDFYILDSNKIIENKALDEDLKNSARILLSSDTPGKPSEPFDYKMLEVLRQKHPFLNPTSLFPSQPISINFLLVKDEDSCAAILSFTSGSASGIVTQPGTLAQLL